jgi:DNA invertase Pin-like site-specific DNA recombinase
MEEKKSKGRAAVYLRKSSLDSRAGKNRSFTRQMADIGKILEEFEVVAEFSEKVGTSASHIAGHDRPEWDKALAGLGHDYDVLVGSQMDRLTRQGIGELVKIYEACEQGTGGRVITCDWDSDSSESRIVGPLIAELARAEVSRLQERVVAGKKIAEERKDFMGGPHPYPWNITRDADGTFVYSIIPERQRILTEFAEMYVAGKTGNEIGDYAREQGYQMAKGQTHWEGNRILKYLDHPACAGHMQLKGKLVSDDDGNPIQYTDPVVPPNLYAQYKEERAKRKKRDRKQRCRNTKYLLSGLAFCEECGKSLYIVNSGADGAGIRSYACIDAHHHQKQGVKMWHVSRDEVEAVISLEVVKLLSELEPDSKMALTVLNQLNNHINPTHRLESIELNTALLELDERLGKIRSEFLVGDMDEDEFEEIKNTAQRRREVLLEKQRNLPQVSLDLNALFDWTEVGPIGEGSLWASLQQTQKRDLVEALIERIEITPAYPLPGYKRTTRKAREGWPPIEERIHIYWKHETNVTELKTRTPAALKLKARKAS